MAGSISLMNNVVSTEARATGKRYFEILIDATTQGDAPAYLEVGFTRDNPPPGSAAASSNGIGWGNSSRIYRGSTDLLGYSAGRLWSPPNVFRFAVDFDAGEVWMTKDADAWIGGGDPATGVDPTATFTSGDPFFICASGGNNADFFGETIFLLVATLRVTTAQFTGAVPSGFVQFT